jgi:hypothetical protein
MFSLGKKYWQFYFIILSISVKLFSACSDEEVILGEAVYEPKIVVEGYLYPEHCVDNLKICRNIPFNQVVDYEKTIIADAKVILTDLSSDKNYELTYDKNNLDYGYEKKDFKINFSNSYKLEVWASIDRQNLYVYSVTTTPATDIKIEKDGTDTIIYRQKDKSNNLIKYKIKLHPPRQAEIIVVSVTAEQPGAGNFIFDNPYLKIDSSDVANDITRYSYQCYSLDNYNPAAEELNFNIDWTLIWFYGKYRVIIYAGDKNFKDFFLTQKDIQEPGGNFHELKIDFIGDGIGVFASLVADTTYFFVKK